MTTPKPVKKDENTVLRLTPQKPPKTTELNLPPVAVNTAMDFGTQVDKLTSGKKKVKGVV